MKRFNSIQQIKQQGEHIAAGSIIPRRIVKAGRRKHQHCLVAGSNQWAFPTKRGYLVFVENNDGTFKSVLEVRRVVSGLQFLGAPYTSGGNTHWQGNCGWDEAELLEVFNRKYSELNA